MKTVRLSVILVAPVLALACHPVVSSASSAEPGRGNLVAIGGDSRPASIMGLFACLAGGAQGRVLVFPQASERPEAGAEIEKELEALGIGRVIVVPVDHAGADSDETLRLAKGATGVYFGGGDQARLMAVLHGTRLEQALGELALFDWVILDTPPVGVLADASVLSGMVDGGVLVVKSGVTPFPQVEAAVAALGRDHILGILLNAVDPADIHGKGYYYHYYGPDGGERRRHH